MVYTLEQIIDIINGLQMNNPYNMVYEYDYYTTYRKTLDIVISQLIYNHKKNLA